jgi:hypothetical protein
LKCLSSKSLSITIWYQNPFSKEKPKPPLLLV